MHAVDTNVLVRLLARDDSRQLAAAEAFVASGAWVSILTLVETVWVLKAVYGRNPSSLAGAIEQLLDHDKLVLEHPDAVGAALNTFRSKPALSFSDCLTLELARKAGHLPLGTFDRRLGRAEGCRLL